MPLQATSVVAQLKTQLKNFGPRLVVQFLFKDSQKVSNMFHRVPLRSINSEAKFCDSYKEKEAFYWQILENKK